MATSAIYHHMTPQTYMRSWKHGNSSVYVVEKGNEGVIGSKSTRKFAGIDNYHSFRAGSLSATTSDCDKFFEPLENYTVTINDVLTANTSELNKHFYDFDNWIILDDSSTVVSDEKKNQLKKEILSIHIRDIEVSWDRQYENFWNTINDSITNAVYSNPTKNTIPAIKREDLIKFMVSLEWRTKPYHPTLLSVFEKTLSKEFLGVDFKSIKLDESERLYPFLETYYDEFAHSYILKLYREFLAGTGVIMAEAENFIKNATINLLIAPSNKEFITSDNPVCRYSNSSGKTEYIFPLNPKLACQVTKTSSGENYLIHRLDDEEVININTQLKVNCNKGYILREPNLSLYFE